jgi:hypothetical protein
VDDGPPNSGPASRPSGRPLSSRPEDRATPVADAGAEYASYIGATKAQTRNTQRIDAGDLVKLVDQTRRTGATKRSAELSEAIDQGLLRKSAARTEPPADEAPAPRVRPRRALAAIGALAVILTGAVLWSLQRRAEPAPVPAATMELQAAPSPSAPAGETSTPPAASASAPPASRAETEAREALERLRTGLGECIRHGIHSLPGTSPAVPSSLSSTKGRGYTPALVEWKTAVWSCARFRVAGAMSFQVQWQLVKAGAEGLAVAWIDDDGDGAADRALGFHITLGQKGEPVLGDVGPLPATHPVVVVR